MIELKQDRLIFSFPELHPQARLTIEMQRTLRIPDDGKTYPLPPGLGQFPLRHVDDFASAVPDSWRKRGGVMMPMYQSEALWLRFDSNVFRPQRESRVVMTSPRPPISKLFERFRAKSSIVTSSD